MSSAGCIATRTQFDVSTRHVGNTLTLSAHGELDIATAPVLETAVAMAAASRADAVVLDLSKVSFIDSSGLHALLSASEVLGERLQIVASDACRRLMMVAGIADALRIA